MSDGSDGEVTAWLREADRTLGTAGVLLAPIAQDGRKGRAAAVNAGIRASRARHVVTLDSDAIVTPFWLDGLLRCMAPAPEIGIAARPAQAGNARRNLARRMTVRLHGGLSLSVLDAALGTAA